jgi:hypothetical protein
MMDIAVQGERPDWYPDWSGETVVIVAGGPSAADIPLDKARGNAKFITVNDSWKLAPWADALFAGFSWWAVNHGVPAFQGLKISQDFDFEHAFGVLMTKLRDIGLLVEGDPPCLTAPSLQPEFEEILIWGRERHNWGLKQVRGNRDCDQIIITPGEIGSNGVGGGFQALNLAIQFGAKRIVLVGYDMRIDRGICWHGKYGQGLINKTETDVIRWRKKLDAQAPLLKEIGVEVLNASAVSTLTAYPKVDFAATLGQNEKGSNEI